MGLVSFRKKEGLVIVKRELPRMKVGEATPGVPRNDVRITQTIGKSQMTLRTESAM